MGVAAMEELPKIIRIMPDYGPSYASDEEYCSFDLSGCLIEGVDAAAIQEIEDQLYVLANRIDSGEADGNPNFPWEEIDRRAYALTVQLAVLLKDHPVQVFYRSHFNNPLRVGSGEVLVTGLGDACW